jgi:hypothetical protein
LFAAGIETILLTGKVIPFGDSIRCLPDCTKAKQRFGLAFIGAARQKQCQTDNNDVYQNGVSSAFSHRAYLQQHAALTCLPITSSLKTSRQSAGDFGFLDLDHPLLRSLLGVKRTWVGAPHMSAFGGKAVIVKGDFTFKIPFGFTSDVTRFALIDDRQKAIVLF